MVFHCLSPLTLNIYYFCLCRWCLYLCLQSGGCSLFAGLFMKRRHLHGWSGLKVRHGLKVLGVFLDREEFQKKNWEGAKEKMCARLSKRKWLLPQLSYREEFWSPITWSPRLSPRQFQRSRLHQTGTPDEGDTNICGHSGKEEQHQFCKVDKHCGDGSLCCPATNPECIRRGRLCDLWSEGCEYSFPSLSVT